MSISIEKITDSNLNCVLNLVAEADEQGCFFVQKTVDEWIAKSNAFDKNGEALFGAFDGQMCVAICGLNIDPYVDDAKIGRIRHLYVLSGYRRKGVAKMLVKSVLDIAKDYFAKVRLFTNNKAAAKLYESIGFVCVDEFKATHVFDIGERK